MVRALLEQLRVKRALESSIIIAGFCSLTTERMN